MKTTTKTRSVPASRAYLFDATAEAPADNRYPRAVLRWLLDVAARRGVGHRATRLLCALEAHADDEGRCFPSIETLARQLGHDDTNSSHVYRDLTELVDAGLVEKRHEGRRVVRYVLHPAAYGRNGHVDVAETNARRGRNGHVDVAGMATGSTQPKTQEKNQPKTQRVRGSSSSGSGRVQNEDADNTVQRDTESTVEVRATGRLKALRDRVEHLDDPDEGATAAEIVETCRGLGIRNLSLVQQRLGDRGLPWLRDLLDTSGASTINDRLGFVLSRLTNPDKFERPESATVARPQEGGRSMARRVAHFESMGYPPDMARQAAAELHDDGGDVETTDRDAEDDPAADPD